ncbi:selenium binding protein [Latilactobacillus sakei]|uniref:selenium binding protein n=1 Tax=Latilactobacillus sakei TaxID=1599 RepID=UPI003F53A139
MYEKYTRQSLPSKKYRELLGSSITVFNSNNSFMIENYLKIETSNSFDWYSLIDMTSGLLKNSVQSEIKKASNLKIMEKFEELVEKRNRIVHSFQITDIDGEQRLASKDRNHVQFVITEDYLYQFIKENEELSEMLHKLRGY